MRLLIDRPDGAYCFRLHRDRVFYISEKLLKHAVSIDRDHLMSIGTCFGKFTKTRKFRLHITALDYLAPYAQVGCHSHELFIYSKLKCYFFISTKFGLNQQLNSNLFMAITL